MRILITTVQVPFVHGGAEVHATELQKALDQAGHQVEIVAVPFKWYPPERILDHMLACRLLDLTETMGTSVDLVIGLKFPAYLIPHPNKVLWILHQYRAAYDLWGHPYGDLHRHPEGAEVREAIRQADRNLIAEARSVFANSANVAHRLHRYCGLESTPLYHPPRNAERFYCAQAEDYLFFPSRLTPIKRQALVLEALARTRSPVRVRFAGAADQRPHAAELRALAERLGVAGRAEWLGPISEEEKHRLYAHALGVVYPPVDEDYGYVTLETMLSAKPLITCTDSGGPLEFVEHHQTGLVAGPAPDELAAAMDEMWERRVEAGRWGEAARARLDGMNITWPAVVQRLLS